LTKINKRNWKELRGVKRSQKKLKEVKKNQKASEGVDDL